MNTSTLQKKAVYEWVDENRPDLWDRPLTPDDLTDDLVATLVEVTKTVGPQRERNTVRTWLLETQKHSPFIDEIAVERALDFDWDVYERLTLEERREFYRRLAAMDDPFSEHHPLDFIFTSGKGGEWLNEPHPRNLRFRAGTDRQRDTVRQAVQRARQRLAAAA